MTRSKIQHILSGLKSEIARERDQDRRMHLADMGCFWNDLLLYGFEIKHCPRCGEELVSQKKRKKKKRMRVLK